jgi:hypothetical protein
LHNPRDIIPLWPPTNKLRRILLKQNLGHSEEVKKPVRILLRRNLGHSEEVKEQKRKKRKNSWYRRKSSETTL